MNHFVVLERVSRGRALIHDPEGHTKWFGSDELSKHFTGIAMELRPTDDFEPTVRRDRLRLPQLWRRMTGMKRALAQVIVLSLVMQAYLLASPYYMQVAIDSALPALDRDLLTVLAFGFGLFMLMNVGALLLRSFVLLSAGTSMSFGVSANLARRLFRLPVSWFEKRHVGDILSRFGSITPIQKALTQGAVAALLDGALALLTLSMMIFYSGALAVISISAFVLYVLVRWVSFALERTAQESVIVAHAKEQSTLIESIRGIVTLRLFNRESARHAFWQTRLSDAVNADITLARVGNWQQASNALIFGSEAVVSVWMTIRFVMDGGFSLGMVFAYLAYKAQFLQKSTSLVDQLIAFRMLGLHLERLSDIAMADQDPSFVGPTTPKADFSGRLELRNVRFRYSPNDSIVLDGVTFDVAAGDYVAITGPSGGGKSTLVKILLGLVEPDEGELLLDGTPIERFGYKNYHDQIAAVLQDDSLFAGSLAENIALFDEAPDMKRIVAAAQTAALHNDISRMPMGYETLVGDMGSSLSGGQRQRVLIARALYRQPKLLIMDEGTSALDSALEKQVNSGISGLGVTRIIVAHRAETVRAAASVYVLEGGKLVKMPMSLLDASQTPDENAKSV